MAKVVVESYVLQDDKVYHFKGNGILSSHSLVYFDDTNTKIKINFLENFVEKEDNESIFKLFYGSSSRIDYYLKAEKLSLTLDIYSVESNLQDGHFRVLYHLADNHAKFEFKVDFIKEDF